MKKKVAYYRLASHIKSNIVRWLDAPIGCGYVSFSILNPVPKSLEQTIVSVQQYIV